MAGEWEFRDAISDVSSIRLITIPRQNFKSKELSVPGFREYLRKDNFESLATIKEKGDRVEVFIQQAGSRNNRYLIVDANDVIYATIDEIPLIYKYWIHASPRVAYQLITWGHQREHPLVTSEASMLIDSFRLLPPKK